MGILGKNITRFLIEFLIMLPSISRTILRTVSNQCKRQLSLTPVASVRVGSQNRQPLAKPLQNIQEVQTDTSEEDIKKTKGERIKFFKVLSEYFLLNFLCLKKNR